MSDHDAFERILTSLHEAMLDDVWCEKAAEARSVLVESPK